jgi:hypothetical protein
MNRKWMWPLRVTAHAHRCLDPTHDSTPGDQAMARSLLRIVIVPPALLAAGPTIAATAGEVAIWCTDATASMPNLCESYLHSAYKLLRSEDPGLNGGGRACVPMDEPTDAVTPMLAKWLEQHPGGGEMNAFDAIAPLLREKYPCRGE